MYIFPLNKGIACETDLVCFDLLESIIPLCKLVQHGMVQSSIARKVSFIPSSLVEIFVGHSPALNKASLT
jgi:hypothetical protein